MPSPIRITRVRKVLSVLALFIFIQGCCPPAPCCPAPAPTIIVVDTSTDPPTVTYSLTGVIPIDWDVAVPSVEDSPCDSVPPEVIDIIALTGGTTFEHEVHDCQRLIDPNGNFGPLVGVFPLDQAMNPTGTESGWRPIANLYNWGGPGGTDLSYEPLGIPRGFSCLWLHAEGAFGPAVRMMAAIDSTACHQTDDGSLRTGPDWQVHREFAIQVSIHEDGLDAPYPATARWGWSDAADQHYIGVKCGPAWCSIGVEGFLPVDPQLLEGDYEHSIPGYYDEQHLAVEDANGMLVPGPLGRIYPTGQHVNAVLDGLVHSTADADAEQANPFRSGFIAARMRVHRHSDGSFGGYDQKFFMEVDEDTAHVGIFIRIRPPQTETSGLGPIIQFDTMATFVSSDGGTERAALRHLHNRQHSATGTVRWRWHDHDETAWVSCEEGCCDVQDP